MYSILVTETSKRPKASSYAHSVFLRVKSPIRKQYSKVSFQQGCQKSSFTNQPIAIRNRFLCRFPEGQRH